MSLHLERGRPAPDWRGSCCRRAVAVAIAMALGACGGGARTRRTTARARSSSPAACARKHDRPLVQYNHEATERFNEKYKGRYRVEFINNQHAQRRYRAPRQYYQRLAARRRPAGRAPRSTSPSGGVGEDGQAVLTATSLARGDPAWRDSFHDGVLDDGPGRRTARRAGDPAAARPDRHLLQQAAVQRRPASPSFPKTWDEFEATCEKIKGDRQVVPRDGRRLDDAADVGEPHRHAAGRRRVPRRRHRDRRLRQQPRAREGHRDAQGLARRRLHQQGRVLAAKYQNAATRVRQRPRGDGRQRAVDGPVDIKNEDALEGPLRGRGLRSRRRA